MGIATHLAQRVDIVCCINGVSRVLLLRQTRDSRYPGYRIWQVLGTALLTRDFDLHDRVCHASGLTWYGTNKTMDIKVDEAPIYILLS